MPTARFVVVGDGELRADVDRRIDELGLRDCMTVVGWRDDLAPIYSDLDLKVLTSENEGTPLTIIEALAAGVPIVATAVGGVPDLLEHGRLGRLVPPGDGDALAKAILASLRAPAEPVGARSSIAERYGIDRLVRERDLLYRGILARKRAPAHSSGGGVGDPSP